MLKLFNTLTRKKGVFKAAKDVGFYFCGPTVYDYAHIGNLRSYVFADVLRRYLEFLGYNVKMVMNITDVDDKTIRNSRKEGIPLAELTQRYEKAFMEDVAALRIKPASVYPRATEHISEMVALINSLLKKGFAYASSDGVYFDISRFPAYGKLSHLRIRELQSTVSTDEYSKEQAQDFALWKAWSADDGDVFWTGKFGGKDIKGRPGWHIECSAMSTKYLKTPIDIHGGGVDLVFPHHENEIAQCTGNFARYWVHCEHLMVNGQKMSKSMGNFYTLRDVLEKGYDPIAIRFLLLNAHYRQQLNFTLESLEKAKETVYAINDFAGKLAFLKGRVDAKENKGLWKAVRDAEKNFAKHMNDDLNVPLALAAVFGMINDVNKAIDSNAADKKSLQSALELIEKINSILDILKEEKTLTKEEQELVEKREQLRKEKKFAEADKIRALLGEKGVALEDTPYGPRARKDFIKKSEEFIKREREFLEKVGKM